jgi:hypothetical protein
LTSDNVLKKITVNEVIGYLFSLGLAGVFLYFALYNVDSKSLFEIIKSASIPWIAIFAFLTLFAHYLRALRWQIILSSVKKDASTFNLFGALLIGYGVNNIIPRLGEISRAVAAGHSEGVSRSSVFGTIIVERIVDIIFFGLCVVASSFLYQGNLYGEFPWLKTTIFIGSFLILISVIVLVLAIRFVDKFNSIIMFIIGHVSSTAGKKLASIFEKMTRGFSSLKGVKNYFLVISLSVLMMFVYSTTTYVGLLSLGMQEVQNVDFASAWIIMSLSSIGVMIPTPGGIGSYHTITKSVLVSLFGFSIAISAAYAILTHGISYIVHIIMAVFFFFLFKKRFPKNNKNLLVGLNDNE